MSTTIVKQILDHVKNKNEDKLDKEDLIKKLEHYLELEVIQRKIDYIKGNTDYLEKTFNTSQFDINK